MRSLLLVVLVVFAVTVSTERGDTSTDSDGDGMPDGYEQQHPCLNGAVPDAEADPDADGITNVGEYATSATDPCAFSTDGDACADSNELGRNQIAGGKRSPLEGWDFFDVNANAVVDLTDTLSVLAYFGDPGTSAAGNLRDRMIPDSGQPWRTAEANNGVDLVDALASLQSFGHHCTLVTGSRGYAMGWAPTPPAPDIDTLIATAQSLSAVSEYTLIQREVPWSGLLAGEQMQTILDEYQGLVDLLRSLNLEPLWLIDPLDGLDRTKEPPELVAAGHSLMEPAIRAMHEDWVRAIAERFDPAYLGLASEINTLAGHGSTALYDEIVDMINELAPEVRLLAPGAQVFVSFQMEDAWQAPGFPPSQVDQFTLIDDFDIDALGLSSYPVFNYGDPADLPSNYYQRFDDATGLPLIQVEGGWSSAASAWGSGSHAEQVAYFSRVGQMLNDVGADLWVMLIYADLDLTDPLWALPPDRAATLANFASMGIVDINLAPKPAYSPWLTRYNQAWIP